MPWQVILLIVLVSVAALTGLTFAVMIFKAQAVARAMTRRSSVAPDAEIAKRAQESLSAVLKYRTVAYSDSSKFERTEWVRLRDYLHRRYPNVHTRTEREVLGDYSLLYRWKSADPTREPILLCGHLDVVPANGMWEYPPFSGENAVGYVWGRGALSGKSTLVCILEAVEHLIGQGFSPKGDVYLAFSHDRELGGVRGAASIARVFAEREIHFSMILDEGGCITRGSLPMRQPIAYAALCEKGCVEMTLTASGSGGHAANPPQHTAAGLIAEAVARTEFKSGKPKLTKTVRRTLREIAPALPFKWRFAIVNLPLTKARALRLCETDPLLAAMTRTTFAVTQMSCGDTSEPGTILPVSARATLNARLLTGEDPESTIRFVKDLIFDLGVGTEVEKVWEPSEVSPEKAEGFNLIRSCVSDVFGFETAPSVLPRDSDARHYAQYSKQVYRFSPFVLTGMDMNRVFAVDEGIKTEGLGLAVLFYRELIVRAG